MKRRKNIAVLLAAGKSERMKMNIYKQFVKINGKYLFEYSLMRFISVDLVDEIFLVVNKEYLDSIKEYINKNYPNVYVCEGGDTRAKSLDNGINYVKSFFYKELENINIISHDVARPFVSRKIIEENIKALDVCPVVNTIYPSSDSLVVTHDWKTVDYPNRGEYFQVQTPQSFWLEKYIIANFRKLDNKHEINDVAKMFFLNNFEIYNTHGEKVNFKVTDRTDLEITNYIIKNIK